MNDSSLMAAISLAIAAHEKVYWKEHVLARMRQRGIRADDILDALASGRIIEEYRTDKPFPSVLVNGRTKGSRPLHVVVGVNAEAGEIHIVTGYEPESGRWNENFSVRKQI